MKIEASRFLQKEVHHWKIWSDPVFHGCLVLLLLAAIVVGLIYLVKWVKWEMKQRYYDEKVRIMEKQTLLS